MIFIKLTLLLSIFSINAQSNDITIEVLYDYSTNLAGTGFEYRIDSELIYNKNYSIYEMDHTKSFGSKDSIIQVNENKRVYGIRSKENTFVFKDFLNNSMYASNNIGLTPIYIKGEFNNLINWELKDEKKEILGYKCQKAICEFGGRQYEAYFTSEISIPNGPWRFQGLPGLILEVKSTDEAFSLIGTALKIKKEKVEIVNPYADKKTMSWESFLVLYRKKYDEMLRNSWSRNGSSASLSKGGIIKYIYD